jgi:hypothetical protein
MNSTKFGIEARVRASCSVIRRLRKPFSCEIGNLVRCRVDFDRLTERYKALFATVKAPEEEMLKKSLGKVGLASRDGKLRVGNQQRTVNHLISGISFHDSTSEKMRGK